MKEKLQYLALGAGNVRRTWLYAFLIQTFIPLLYFAFGAFVLEAPKAGLGFIGGVLCALISLVFNLYFAYEKRGVKWLLFMIVCYTINVLCLVGCIAYNLITDTAFTFDSTSYFLFPLQVVVAWYSYLLRNENQQLLIHTSK